MGADGGVVTDLDEVVDFGTPADAGLFKAGSVDGGVGANFDVIFEDDDAHLVLLLMFSLGVGGVAKAA